MMPILGSTVSTVTEPSLLPVFACLASLLAIPGILAFRKSPNAREGVTFIAGGIKLALVLMMVPGVLSGKMYEFRFFELVEGVGLEFRVDGLGLLFGIVASFLWLCTTLYAIGYMRAHHETNQTRFFSFFALSLCATLGVAFAGNLLTLYIFYEMLSLSTFPLVSHHGDKKARTGGRTYLSYLLGASIGLALPALIFCYTRSPEGMDFMTGGFMAGKVGATEAAILLLMFAYGFAKCGLMPLHSWLPGAMVAPTPVSALLHAVAVVKVGVFCVIRVVTGVFGTDFLLEVDAATALQWAAAITVVVSSLIALSQDNLKRMLAFSTIGQLGYIVLGVALLSPKGVAGSMLHIAMHATGKITLFMCAGAIFVATGKKYISQMEGMGRTMPLTFAAFFIGSLSVIGLPPTGGFISKFYLVMGTIEAGKIPLLVVFLVSTILNAAYFMPIVFRAFFPRGPTAPFRWDRVQEVPKACLIPILITATITILAFFVPELGQRLAALMVPGL